MENMTATEAAEDALASQTKRAIELCHQMAEEAGWYSFNFGLVLIHHPEWLDTIEALVAECRKGRKATK